MYRVRLRASTFKSSSVNFLDCNCVRSFSQRSLHQNEEKEVFHHEYSMRPDQFVFKVGKREIADFSRNEGINDSSSNSGTSLPVQGYSNGFMTNWFQYIYKHSTNYPFKEEKPQQVFDKYPLTNSKKLARQKIRPKKVKMTTCDFIDDALYNPHYGYFSKEVEIFQPAVPFDYQNIRDIEEFYDNWKSEYRKMEAPSLLPSSKVEDKKKKEESVNSQYVKRAATFKEREAKFNHMLPKANNLQVWHTPTSLFQPYYGEAIARHLLVNYKLNGSYPYNDLIIFEVGGGNGTLMCNILNYIKLNEPDVYEKTHYNIIEILSKLAEKQTKNAMNIKLQEQGLDPHKFQIINKSIFDWEEEVTEPCFFISLEVFDNFAHDLIRYDNLTGQPYQGHVLIDREGDFFEFFTPELDYYVNAFLHLREKGTKSVLKKMNTLEGSIQRLKSMLPFLTDKGSIHPLLHSSLAISLKNSFHPFRDNLTTGEFIPTKLLQFFHILKTKFPQHSLISSDFNSLPKTIPGYYNGPVVQTVLQNEMVDVTTYLCLQGYFDIMFPTDFDLAGDLYRQITGKVPRIELHGDFLRQWANIEATTTKKGENPMLDLYQNASFLIS